MITERAKEFRNELKAKGWNRNFVSVCCRGNSLQVTIKKPFEVPQAVVKDMGLKYENYSRDHATGCILRGSNTFVSITVDPCARFEVKNAEILAEIENLENGKVAKFEEYRIQKHDTHDWSFCHNTFSCGYLVKYYNAREVAKALTAEIAEKEAQALLNKNLEAELAQLEEENLQPKTEQAQAQVNEKAQAAGVEAEEEPQHRGVADYQERQEKKRERYAELASKNSKEAQRRFAVADLREEKSGIPMGQPVLVGHHSEKRHRKALERSWNNLGAGVEAQKKAEYYERRAEAVGEPRTISADDPEAVVKLRAKLALAEKTRELYKQTNKAVKKKGATAESIAKTLNIHLETAKKLLEPDFCGRIGVPAYKLTNLGANIRRMKQRLDAILAEAKKEQAPEVKGEGFLIRENYDENRIQIIMDKKPPKELCRTMKKLGFVFSRRNTAWQRQLNNAGRRAAQEAYKILNS